MSAHKSFKTEKFVTVKLCTTSNVAKAKARKRLTRQRRLQGEIAEADRRDISVEQLRRERWQEARKFR